MDHTTDGLSDARARLAAALDANLPVGQIDARTRSVIISNVLAQFDATPPAITTTAIAAGEERSDIPDRFESWWATYKHRNRDQVGYSMKKQIAFDAYEAASVPKAASEDGAITPEWCLRMAELEAGQEIGAGALDHPLRLKCELPPAGWICTRAPGHDGPCAAVASEDGATGLLDKQIDAGLAAFRKYGTAMTMAGERLRMKAVLVAALSTDATGQPRNMTDEGEGPSVG